MNCHEDLYTLDKKRYGTDKMSGFQKYWLFTEIWGIKIITYKIGIEKEHYLLQNVSCLKLRTEVE